MEHHRFLILQGEVEAIALMPPKTTGAAGGLLEYVEDVIGTAPMHAAIAASEQAADQAQEAHGAALARQRSAAAALEKVADVATPATAYCNAEVTLLRTRSIYAQHVVRGGLVRVQELEALAKSAEVEYERQTALHGSTSSEVAAARQAMDAAERAAAIAVQLVGKERSAVRKAEAQIIEEGKMAEMLTLKATKAVAAVLTAEAAVRDNEESQKEARGDADQRTIEVNSAELSRERVQELLDRAVDSAEDRVRPTRKALDAAVKRRAPFSKAVKEREADVEVAKQAHLAASEQIVSLKKRMQSCEGDVLEATRKLGADQEVLAAVAEQLNDAKLGLQRLKGDATAMDAKLQVASARSKELAAQRAEIRGALQEQEARGAIDIHLRRTRGVPGYVGRIGSLASIDPEV